MKKLITLALAVMLCMPAAFAQENFTIGIAQFAVHGSLDNAREGFLQGLAQQGFVEGTNITVDVQNAQAEMGPAAQIASNFVDNNYDLIAAIATPMAVVAVNTADGKIPVVYSAVSDPVAAGLATGDGLGEGPTTGTSDVLPVREQIETIRALLPDAKTIGILYTVAEVNSQVQLAEYQRLAPDFGFAIESVGISQGADVALALPGLVAKADCLSMLLDNTVVQYLDVVLDATDAAGIPVFGSEIEQVVRGCVASEGLDYIALGIQTGTLAARVLKGEDASQIPFETIIESALYINSEKMIELNITVPDDLIARATDVAQK